MKNDGRFLLSKKGKPQEPVINPVGKFRSTREGIVLPCALGLTPTQDKALSYQKENRENPTPAEASFEKLLIGLKVRYQTQRIIRHKHGFFLIDFFLGNPYRVAVEIDGGSHNQKMAYDDRRENVIARKLKNIPIWRFTNQEILEDGFKKILVVALEEHKTQKEAFNKKRKDWTANELEGRVSVFPCPLAYILSLIPSKKHKKVIAFAINKMRFCDKKPFILPPGCNLVSFLLKAEKSGCAGPSKKLAKIILDVIQTVKENCWDCLPNKSIIIHFINDLEGRVKITANK